MIMNAKPQQLNIMARRHAFTLIELMIVVIMLVVLMTTMVWVVGRGYSYKNLDQGSRQFVTMLRMMRAESTNTGRRFRLNFVEPGTATTEGSDGEPVQHYTFQVLWEPQPLAEPGQFIPYDELWAKSVPNDLVIVRRSTRTKSGAMRVEVFASGETGDSSEDSDVPQSIDFFPDGTSESAEIELVSISEQDPRMSFIKLTGSVGILERRLYTESEFEEYLAKQEEQ